jgi:hypothetical protein
MSDQRFWRTERVAGLFLVLGFVTNFAGVVMFNIRGGASGGAPPSFEYYQWERGLFIAAVVLAAIGFVLLEEHLHTSDGRVLARIGASTYVFAAILGVVAEALDLSGTGRGLYPLIVVHVVLGFLGQAAIGGALRQARFLTPWIGWATIVWNLAWLVVLPMITPRDIYFPILHALMPLLIGVALLRRPAVSQSIAQQIRWQETHVSQ